MRLNMLPAVAAGLFSVFAFPAHASVSDQETVMTFNAPVELPGQVLNPGTYVFKLEDDGADQNAVLVYTQDEKHLVGTFLSVPDYRMKAPSKPIVTFSERAEGAPEAIKAWFYPGDNYGHEFVYPKSKATAIAKTNNQPVASMSDEEFNGSSRKSGHVKAVQPTGEEVETSEAFGSRQSSPGTSTDQDDSAAGNNSNQSNTSNKNQ